MPPDIDFTKGGYGGTYIEEHYKRFTSQHMEYWWQFREVLRASDRAPQMNWKHLDGNPLTDNEYRELIALSLTNYAVYTGIADALAFHEQLSVAVSQESTRVEARAFDVYRNWKALYSSLYSGLTALCNIIRIVIKTEPAITNRNWTLGKAVKYISGKNAVVETALNQCEARLAIRSHLDHYWTIWTCVGEGIFLIDSNFSKGYLPVHPETEVNCQEDALKRAQSDIETCADDFNSIYKEISRAGGNLDQYLASKDWEVNYKDFGAPHFGHRPKP